MQHATGTTMATLNHGVLNRLLLKLPPLPEQPRDCGRIERRGRADRRARCAGRQKARHQAGCDAATPHRQNPPAWFPWAVGGERLGEYGDFKGGNGFALKYQGKATGRVPLFQGF